MIPALLNLDLTKSIAVYRHSTSLRLIVGSYLFDLAATPYCKFEIFQNNKFIPQVTKHNIISLIYFADIVELIFSHIHY